MGWALKCSRARSARFFAKQKEYLSAKIQIGERIGLKADPASVAIAMRKAKDVNGERLFDSTEFLTAQQVASFFSRLAAKKTTEDHTAHLQLENHLQKMRDNIVTSMSIQNSLPIVYDSFVNLCKSLNLHRKWCSVIIGVQQHFETKVLLADEKEDLLRFEIT